MRIAIANWSSRRAGGAETYIETIVEPLTASDHDLAILAECDLPADRAPILLGESVPVWIAGDSKHHEALRQLGNWQPDVIYENGLRSAELGRRLRDIAPTIVICHNYYGTCISGSKTLGFPETKPCHHRFDLRCVARYYPRRCGGWNPATMTSDRRRQADRLKMLQSDNAVITISEHMRSEYIRHGLDPQKVVAIPPPISTRAGGQTQGTRWPSEGTPFGLLFLGRMDRTKGAAIALECMPSVAAALDREVHFTLAGDGPERERLQVLAARVGARCKSVETSFPGWIEQAALNELLAASHLLVVPSLWPEPFGLVGLEVGLFGVPTAAFGVGGIPEWLIDGKNGHLAPNPPATADAIAEAIVSCLGDQDHYEALCRGAVDTGKSFSAERHTERLIEVFERVMRS